MDIHYCSLCRIRKLPCLNPLADAPRRQDQPGRGAEEGISVHCNILKANKIQVLPA